MTAESQATSEIIAGLVARLEQLEAQEAIREVMYRYARGADRGDSRGRSTDPAIGCRRLLVRQSQGRHYRPTL